MNAKTQNTTIRQTPLQKKNKLHNHNTIQHWIYMIWLTVAPTWTTVIICTEERAHQCSTRFLSNVKKKKQHSIELWFNSLGLRMWRSFLTSIVLVLLLVYFWFLFILSFRMWMRTFQRTYSMDNPIDSHIDKPLKIRIA